MTKCDSVKTKQELELAELADAKAALATGTFSMLHT
jgi:hypothetical protein